MDLADVDLARVALTGAVGVCGAVSAYMALGETRQGARSARTDRAAPSRADPVGELVDQARKKVEAVVPALAEMRRQSERQRRTAEGLQQMPEMLDVLTLGLSAGLSFDASLELYCDRNDCSLSRAFREAMQSWRMGISTRDEALRKLSDDLGLGAMRRFSAARGGARAAGPGDTRRAAGRDGGADRESAGQDADSAGDAHRARDAHCDPGTALGLRAHARVRCDAGRTTGFGRRRARRRKKGARYEGSCYEEDREEDRKGERAGGEAACEHGEDVCGGGATGAHGGRRRAAQGGPR